MEILDCRAQLLENVKFLYGSDIYILTLSHNSGYQAVVSRYANFTKSWTKLLHSAKAITRLLAMTYLLRETEEQIVKMLEENEIRIPFSGEQEVVEVCLQKGLKGRKKARANGSCGSSDLSGFEFMDTPGESLPENQEIVGELSEKELPVVDRDFIEGEKVELPPEPEMDECHLLEEKPIHESYDDPLSCPEYFPEDPKEEELIREPAAPENYPEEGKEVEIGPTSESYEHTSTGFHDPWTFFGIPKTHKKKTNVKNLLAPVQNPEPEPELAGLVPKPEVNTWGFLSNKNPFEQSAAVESSQPESEPAPHQPEHEQVLELGSLPKNTKQNAKNKMKKGKAIIVEPVPAPSEPEFPVPVSVPKIKKGKKKGKGKGKGKKVKEVLEGDAPVVEGSAMEKRQVAEESSPIKEASTIEEALAIEGCQIFEPVSNIHSLPRDSIWTTGKLIAQEITISEEPVPETAIEEPQRMLIAESITKPILGDSIPSENPILEILEEPAPLSQESKELSLATTSLPSPTPPESTTCTIQTPAKKRQIIVLKTLYTKNMITETLRTIVTLPENTRNGIFSATNSYLDWKIGPGQRNLRIKYGAGKDGDLDIAAVEENLWPDYLEYFRLCTRFPELTVEVVQG